MYTKEQILTASARTQALLKMGVYTDGHDGVVFTKERAQQYIQSLGKLVCVSARLGEESVIFFTDDHCFGGDILPKEWVPCSYGIPGTVVPREGLWDGKITNLEQFIFVFHKDARIIENIDELVEYLNQQERIKHITEVLGSVIADDLKKDMTQNQSSLTKQLGRIMPVRAVNDTEHVRLSGYSINEDGSKGDLVHLDYLSDQVVKDLRALLYSPSPTQNQSDKNTSGFGKRVTDAAGFGDAWKTEMKAVEKHHKAFAEYVAKTKTKAVIEYPSNTDRIIGKKYLVRGVGKRAIVVHLHHFRVEKTHMSDFDIVLKAAQLATQKGWKTIYVDPDDAEGEYAEACNHSMHWKWFRGYRSNGIDLGLVGFNDPSESYPWN